MIDIFEIKMVNQKNMVPQLLWLKDWVGVSFRKLFSPYPLLNRRFKWIEIKISQYQLVSRLGENSMS